MKYAAFTLVLTGSLGACSGMKITADYNPETAPNFSAYQTYAWLPQPIRQDPRVYNAITESRVRRALVWRGVAQARISLNSSPDQRRRKINEAVSKILSNFPPR